MICVNKQWNSSFLYTSSDGPEYVACKVRFGEKVLSVISIYIEPAIAIPEKDIPFILDAVNSPFVMCGDFSARNTLWGGMQCDKHGKIKGDIIDKNIRAHKPFVDTVI